MLNWEKFNDDLHKDPPIDRVFVKINQIDDPVEYPGENIRENNNTLQYEISIIRENMLEYELAFYQIDNYDSENHLSNSVILQYYKPYIQEFYTHQLGMKEQNYLAEFNGQWKAAYLTSDNYKRSSDAIIIEGTLIFSASELKKKQKQLVFDIISPPDTKLVNLIEQLIKAEDKNNIDKRLSKLGLCNTMKTQFENKFKNFLPYSLRIYNVGQGNFFSILGFPNAKKPASLILFDIGMTKSDTIVHKIEDNKVDFHQMEPELIILSHWDTDHIFGVGELPSNIIYNKTVWLAPYYGLLKKRCASSQRLALYLAYKKRIYFVNSIGVNSPLFSSKYSDFSIWQQR